MNINWYPGHMKKTIESIKNNLKLVDVVYELLDARIPLSSRNPDIDRLVENKPRIIILNKADLADENLNKRWKDYFQSKSIKTIIVDCLSKRGINNISRLSLEVTEEKIKALKDRGVINRNIKAMIIGIPNVGKSTLINTLSGRKGTRIGNRPGITRSNQWIRMKDDLELLDTPGVLWPKFEDKEIGLNLAFTGAIKDEILDVESLSIKLIEKLNSLSPLYINKRYDIDVSSKSSLEILENIGIKRGCLLKGGYVDYSKTSNILLDDFRRGNLGRITLESPEEII